MKALLTGGFALSDITVGKLKKVTAKDLYLGYTSTFPPPKVVFKFNVDCELVRKRLQYTVLDQASREIQFMVFTTL